MSLVGGIIALIIGIILCAIAGFMPPPPVVKKLCYIAGIILVILGIAFIVLAALGIALTGL